MSYPYPVTVNPTFPGKAIAYEFANLPAVFEMAGMPPSEHGRLTNEVLEVAASGKPATIGTECRVTREGNWDLRFGFRDQDLAFYFRLCGI